MSEWEKIALNGAATGAGALIVWYLGSFFGDPVKQLQQLRGKVIEQLIHLYYLEDRRDTSPGLEAICKELGAIAAQTQAAFMSITKGLKKLYVRVLQYRPTDGSDSLLKLASLLMASADQSAIEGEINKIRRAYKIPAEYTPKTFARTYLQRSQGHQS